MPDWFPDNLAEVAVFAPLRILFLVVVAVTARQLVCWLINRSVRRAVGYQPQLKFRAAQALVDATTLPAERREQRIGAIGSLGRSTVTFMIIIVTALMILAELGFNITTIVAGGHTAGESGRLLPCSMKGNWNRRVAMPRSASSAETASRNGCVMPAPAPWAST